MILTFGDAEDLSAAYVGFLGGLRNIPLVTLSEDRLGLDWWFAIDGVRGAEIAHGEIGPIDLREVTGAFVRLNPEPSVPDELDILDDVQYLYIQERRAGLQFLLDALPLLVVNRPSAGRSNGSKPLHMARLAKRGFDVPRWVVTNETGIAESFMESCPEGSVVKSCSGLRSHVRMASQELVDVMKATTEPVILQQYVGNRDVRIHVVGDRTFASSIVSDAIDYRFDSEGTIYGQVEVPSDIARLCIRATADEGLVLAGLDFRVDSHGRWWCLELNPVPTFLPYEAGSGHSIGDTIVDLLAPKTHAPHQVSPLAHRLRPAFDAEAERLMRATPP
jgi:glutathione synthase/RimK-type ligase-like ATP-grasp enzyme